MDFADLLVKAKLPQDAPQPTTSKKKIVKSETITSSQKANTTKKQSGRISTGNLDVELNSDVFLSLLKEEYKKNQKASMSYQKKWISPTDICNLCPRKVYYRFTNADYELQLFYPYSEIITHVGNAVHEWVQSLLAKVYKDVQSEVKFEIPEKKLKGYIDLVYKTNEDKTIILEIKTIGDEIHDKQFYGKIPHWKQLATYYWVWTELLGKQCDSVQLMYLKRDFKPLKLPDGTRDLPFKIFTADPVKLWETYKNDILWMYETILNAIEKKQVPDIPPSRLQIIKRDECGFCPYQKICSKDGFVHQQQRIQNSIEWIF